MAYNTVETVGQDIYGFLDFLSRRQGPKDTTNPQPPEVASADAATAPGATMPGTVMDAPPGPILPFQKPVPVSSKPVQLAGALPALAGGGGPAMTMPAGAAGRPMVPPLPKPEDPKVEDPKPIVPTPKEPGPALVSDPGGGANPVPPPLGPAFKPGPNIPMFDPSTGKIDVLGILKQQQDAANRRAAWESIARGGTLMAAAATRSPSMRQVLAHAAGGGGGGGGDGSGSGGINAATLLELDKRSRGEAAAAYKAKIAPALAQHLGVPPEMIQYMDDDKIATLTTAIAKGENLDKTVRDDGSVIWTNKTTGQQFAGPSADQIKVRAAEDAHAKSQADTAQSIATTGKIKEETVEKQEANLKAEELRTLADNPDFLLSLSQQTGQPPSVLRAAFSAGKLPEALETTIKATPLYQEWLKTDRKVSFTEYAKTEQAGRANQPTPAKSVFDTTFSDATKGVEQGRAALAASPNSVSRYNLITQGGVLTGAVWGHPEVQKWAARAANVFGWDPTLIADSQKFINSATSQSVARAKELGTNPTDRDLRIQQQIQGADTSQTKDALIYLTQFSTRSDLRAMLAANEKLDRLAAMYPNDPDIKRYTDANRIQVPNLVNASFEPEMVDGLRKAKASGNTQDLTDTMADFDRMYGRGLAQYVLSQPAE